MRTGESKIDLLTLTAMVLSAVVAVENAHADTTYSYSAICGNVTSTTTTDGGQLAQYCADALTAKNAYAADNTVWKVYAAAAVVCAAECATTAMGFSMIPYGNYVCMGSGLAAAATDALMTKQYTAAMTGAMSAMSGVLLGGGKTATTSGTDAAGSGGQSTDIGSCVAAAGATFSAFEKNQSAQSDLSTENQDLANAQALASSSTTTTTLSPNLVQAASNGGSGTGATSTANNVGGGTAATTAASSGSCGATSSSSVASAVQCAATANPNLASLVGSPQFGQAFQAAAGMPLGDFLSSATKPSSAIAHGLGALTGEDGANNLQAALAQMETLPNFDPAAGTYTGGGGGGSRGGGGDDLNALMGNLMSQFGPKKPGEKESSGVSSASFAGNRGLASATAEDRNVSLFDRVAYRYSRLSPGLLAQASSGTGISGAPSAAAGAKALPTLKDW